MNEVRLLTAEKNQTTFFSLHRLHRKVNDLVENTNTLTTVTIKYTNSIYVDLHQDCMKNKDHPLGPGAESSKQETHKNGAYRRFLLPAQPQIGKTASFLWTVHLFLEHFKESKYTKSEKKQSKYINTLYRFRNQDSDELHSKLKNEQICNDWDLIENCIKLIQH